jgi:hypothetical protein
MPSEEVAWGIQLLAEIAASSVSNIQKLHRLMEGLRDKTVKLSVEIDDKTEGLLNRHLAKLNYMLRGRHTGVLTPEDTSVEDERRVQQLRANIQKRIAAVKEGLSDEHRAKLDSMLRGKHGGVLMPEDTAIDDESRIRRLRAAIQSRLSGPKETFFDEEHKRAANVNKDTTSVADKAQAAASDATRKGMLGRAKQQDAFFDEEHARRARANQKTTSDEDKRRNDSARELKAEILRRHAQEVYIHAIASRYRKLGIGEEEALGLARARVAREAQAVREAGQQDTWLDMLAGGTGLRRAAARGLSTVFGDSAFGKAVAGAGAILAGSVLLRMAWMVGDAILKAPGVILQGRENMQMVGAGATSVSDRMAWAFAERLSFSQLSGSRMGPNAGYSALGTMQTFSVNPDKAAPALAAISKLAIAEGKSLNEMAGPLAHMMATPNADSRTKLVQSSRYIQRALHAAMPDVLDGPEWEKKLMTMIGPAGTIGSENIIQAAIDAANSKEVQGRVDAERKSGPGVLRGARDRIQRNVTLNPTLNPWGQEAYLTERLKEHYDKFPRGAKGKEIPPQAPPRGVTAEGLAAWQERVIAANLERRRPKPEPGFSDISITSIAGMADTMQSWRVAPTLDYAATTARAMDRLLEAALGPGIKVQKADASAAQETPSVP